MPLIFCHPSIGQAMIVAGLFQMKHLFYFVLSPPLLCRICSMVMVTSPDLAVTDFMNNCERDKNPHPGFTSRCSQARNVEAPLSFSLGSSAEDGFQELGSDSCANAKKESAMGCVSVPGVGVAHLDPQPGK